MLEEIMFTIGGGLIASIGAVVIWLMRRSKNFGSLKTNTSRNIKRIDDFVSEELCNERSGNLKESIDSLDSNVSNLSIKVDGLGNDINSLERDINELSNKINGNLRNR